MYTLKAIRKNPDGERLCRKKKVQKWTFNYFLYLLMLSVYIPSAFHIFSSDGFMS